MQEIKKPEWFENDFVKRVIKDIDKAEVLFEEALKDRWGHGMPTEHLSSGSKTLICIYYHPELRFNGSMMGDNCIPFLMEIAKEKDIRIWLEHFMDLRDQDIPFITVDGETVDMYGYECKYSEWSEWVDTCSEEYYEQLDRGRDVIPKKPIIDWEEAKKPDNDAVFVIVHGEPWPAESDDD